MSINNQHKQGYKHTAWGWIPDEWDFSHLENFCSKITDGTHGTPTVTEEGYPYLTAIHVKDGFIDYDNCYYLSKKDHEDIYKRCNAEEGDVLMVNIGAGVASTALVNVDYEFSLKNVALIKPNKNKLDGKYLELFQQFIKPRLLIELLNGGAQPFLGLRDIKRLPFFAPPLPEQRKIAAILSTWDEAITKTLHLIALLQQRNKGLMQQLLTGRIRLKAFAGEVVLHHLKDYIVEVAEKNKDNAVVRVLSVTNSRGFINQSDQFDREVASEDKSNYKIVRKGYFAYNPSRVNVGSLDLLSNFDEGLLSPMYVVFRTDQKNLLSNFLFYQLKSHWFFGHIPMYVQGSVRDSLGFDGLTAMKFFIPSTEEQEEIAELLDNAFSEVKLHEQKIAALRQQKKGLMQKLLTGEVRVKIDNNKN